MKNIETLVVGPEVSRRAFKPNETLILKTGTFAKDPKSIQVCDLSGNAVGYITNSIKSGDGKKFPYSKTFFSGIKDGDCAQFVRSEGAYAVISIALEDSLADTVYTPAATPVAPVTASVISKQFIFVLSGQGPMYPNRTQMTTATKSSPTGFVPATLKESVDDHNNVAYIVLYGDPPSPASIAYETFADSIVKILKNDPEYAKVEPNTPKQLAQYLEEHEDSTVKVEVTMVRKIIALAVVTVETKTDSITPDVEISKLFSGDDATELEKRVDWLKAANCPQYAINLFLTRMKSQKNILPFEPRYIPVSTEVEQAISTFCGDSNHKGNCLMIGPAGCGKNMLVLTLANLFNVPLIDKSCSAGTDEEALFGFLSMSASEEAPDKDKLNEAFLRMLTLMNGQWNSKVYPKTLGEMNPTEQIENLEVLTEADNYDYSPIFDAIRSNTAEIKFQPTDLTKAIEYPSLVNLDEINALRPQVALSLHSLLDTRRYVQVSGYKNVVAHPDMMFCATMNDGVGYSGTSQLNLALADRFNPILFEAPSSIKAIIQKEVPNLKADVLDKLDKLYIKMLTAKAQFENPDAVISIRAFVATAINIAQGNQFKGALKNNLLARIRDVEDHQTVESWIQLLFK